MKLSVIVCAAGSGERAGFGKNKLLAPFCGANALYYSLHAFDFLKDAQKLAVCRKGDVEAEVLCKKLGWQVVWGGATRTESVYNALRETQGDVALIHDGARPYVTEKIICACIECAQNYGSAICARPSTDTVAIADGELISCVPERDKVFCVQTPQCFNAEEIKRAYELAIADGRTYTDDGAVYSRYIRPARLCICGDETNKKLTFKQDFENANPTPVEIKDGLYTGFGVDVHAFGKQQNFVTLCGVDVPCDEGLIAHSDGDVAVHALMDALLTGAGLRDIGHYFPDSDERFKGANSIDLLKQTVNILAEHGFAPAGASVAIQAEKPKLAQYIPLMKSNLCKVLSVDENRVSISAGTSEKLGFVGEKLGICAYCSAVLKEI